MLINYQQHRQGGWDNCWFRSALDGLAFKRPDEIVRMVQPTEYQKFVVTFPGRRPRTVDVTRQDDITYAAVLETAADEELGNARTARLFTYGEGIELLTGHSRTGYTNGTGVGFAPLWVVWSRRDWLTKRLTEATNDLRLMVLGGSDGKWTTPKLSWVQPRHCFSLLEYEPETETARVRNPHGNDGVIPVERKRPGYGPGESWVTLDELEDSWCGLTIEDDR